MSGLEIAIIVAVVLALVGGIVTMVILRLRKSRKEKVNFDFTTKHGIDFKLSPQLAETLTPEMVEEWSESVISFWENAKGWNRKEMLKCLNKIGVFLYDQLWLNRAGIRVNGILWPNKFEIEMATLPKENIGYDTLAKVKSLFRHEVSHVIVGYVGGIPFDNATHHKLFADVGLGA